MGLKHIYFFYPVPSRQRKAKRKESEFKPKAKPAPTTSSTTVWLINSWKMRDYRSHFRVEPNAPTAKWFVVGSGKRWWLPLILETTNRTHSANLISETLSQYPFALFLEPKLVTILSNPKLHNWYTMARPMSCPWLKRWTEMKLYRWH